MGHLIFVTGGARSGKSRHAQGLVEALDGDLLYVATAQVGDAEMASRIDRHRLERGERWQTLEEPLWLPECLPEAARGKGGVLLDCLTLWLTNLLLHFDQHPEPALREVERLLAVLERIACPLVVVSNEVGMGIVPENRLARIFRDLAGTASQRLAAVADEAWLVAAGLPLRLK